jgi:hypothetical protein
MQSTKYKLSLEFRIVTICNVPTAIPVHPDSDFNLSTQYGLGGEGIRYDIREYPQVQARPDSHARIFCPIQQQHM